MSILATPHPSWRRRVFPDDAADPLRTMPTLYGRCRPSGDVATSIPAAPRPTRRRHVHPGDATSIPATPRPSRRRHVHPGDATSIPATPRPSRRRHIHPDDFGQQSMHLGGRDTPRYITTHLETFSSRCRRF